MRAAVLRETGAPLTIEDVTLAPPNPGEVRVRVEAAGVCHSDLHYMTGDLSGRLPAVLGHEGVGVVEETGQGVTRVRPGDRVVLTWRPRCGDCEFCTSGRPTLCTVGRIQASTGGLPDGTSRLSIGAEKMHHLMGVSCFAEYCVVNERSVIAISDDVPSEIAATVGCAVITGVGAALNLIHTATAKPSMVIGAGGVGLSAIMGLALIGAQPLIAVDTVDTRLSLAGDLGATHTINPTTDDLGDVLEELTPGGISWAVDAVGAPSTMEQAFNSLATAGTLVAVGLSSADAGFTVPVNRLVQQERRVIGSLYGSSNPGVQLPQILELYRTGRLPLDRLVGQRYDLDNINEAYASLASQTTGRAVISLRS